MRTPSAVMLLALALTGCVFAVGTGSHPPPPDPVGPYGLEVAIERGADPGTWACNAVVFDLPSGHSIMAPRLLGKVGERAELTSSSGRTSFTVSVLVEEGGQAGWTAEFTRQGQTVARQSGTVRL